MFAGTSPPTGWLLCDGSAVSLTTYANLFAVIGTAYGSGDGATTFNLPDMRGRFARGADNGAGNDPDAAGRTASNPGGNTGDNVGSLQGDAFGEHDHQTSRFNNVERVSSFTASTGTAAPNNSSVWTDRTGGGVVTPRTSLEGNSETRPVNITFNYIIKY